MKLIYLTLLIILPYAVNAQSYIISGYVQTDDGKALEDANIFNRRESINSYTDNTGYFSIKATKGHVALKITFLGFENKTVSFEHTGDTSLNIILHRKEHEIKEVEISGKKYFENAQSITELSAKTIEKIPAAGGEKDLIKALLFVPGVQAGSEATANIFVRGGNQDQNLILLDNIPIYNVSHLFGYMSIFDIDMTQKVRITKGGFPAKYGGRLSSVIEIELKNGDSEKPTGIAKIGLVSSKLQIEIPIKKNSYLLVSGRKTYFDIFARMYNAFKTGNGQKNGNYLSFYDLNIRYTTGLTKKSKLYFNYYMGDDKIEFVNKFNSSGFTSSDVFASQTGNITLSLNFIHTFNNKHSLHLTSGLSRYRSFQSFKSKNENKQTNEIESNYFKEKNQILDYINTLTYKYTAQIFSCQIGGQMVNHRYEPFAVSYDEDSELISKTYRPNEFAIFIDNKITVKKLELNAGLRYNQYTLNDYSYNNLEPRISAKYSAAKNTTIKASYTQMHQYNHLLSNISTGKPVDIWFPATAKTQPIAARQFSVGMTQSNILTFIDAGVEIYYKKINHLIDFSDDAAGTPLLHNIEDFIVSNGNGTSYGTELFVHINHKKLTGLLSYTLSKSERQFDEINSGRPFPFKYDRRHNFNGFLSFPLTKKISLSAAWTYMTGYALTLPEGRYYTSALENSNNASLLFYSDRNQYRMPAYHRLDLAVSHSKKKKKGIRTWEINIYNAYNRHNAYYIDIRSELYYNPDSQTYEYSETKLWQRSLLPIIPSISYSFKF